MEIMSLLLGFLAAPFAFWWTLSWWIITPSAVLFLISIGTMMPDESAPHPLIALVCMMIIFLLTAIGAGCASPVNGFWLSALEGAKFFVKFILGYLACGIVTLLPLWYVNVKRIGRKLKKYYQIFIEKVLKSDEYCSQMLGNTLTAEEKKEIRELNGMKDGKLMPGLKGMFDKYKEHYYSYPSLEAKKNLELISSLIFLWPVHVIVEIFGELIMKMPKYIVKLLNLPLNLISQLATKGLPEDLDN